jgi:hypothetical protein
MLFITNCDTYFQFAFVIVKEIVLFYFVNHLHFTIITERHEKLCLNFETSLNQNELFRNYIRTHPNFAHRLIHLHTLLMFD